jgi:hypothetical protein
MNLVIHLVEYLKISKLENKEEDTGIQQYYYLKVCKLIRILIAYITVEYTIIISSLMRSLSILIAIFSTAAAFRLRTPSLVRKPITKLSLVIDPNYNLAAGGKATQTRLTHM